MQLKKFATIIRLLIAKLVSISLYDILRLEYFDINSIIHRGNKKVSPKMQTWLLCHLLVVQYRMGIH